MTKESKECIVVFYPGKDEANDEWKWFDAKTFKHSGNGNSLQACIDDAKAKGYVSDGNVMKQSEFEELPSRLIKTRTSDDFL